MGERVMIFMATVMAAVFLPYFMTIAINGKYRNYSQIKTIDTGRDVIIQVGDKNQLIDVEEYIAGVLPGLVDWKSSQDILEAQAVAVRTKIYYEMGSETVIKASDLQFTYYTKEDYIEKWGQNNESKIRGIYEEAVINTVEKIIE